MHLLVWQSAFGGRFLESRQCTGALHFGQPGAEHGSQRDDQQRLQESYLGTDRHEQGEFGDRDDDEQEQ